MTAWLRIARGAAPLVVAVPHAGTDIPEDIESRLVSPWLARLDADWWVDRLYDFAADLGATVIATAMSRTVIDVNRDPSGASLYPGQATTDLCPLTTFDGEALYRNGAAPDDAEISRRRDTWFAPYHDAIAGELERLKGEHGCAVLYDAHSIRSRVPRLFDGELPVFNIGSNRGASCATELRDAIAQTARASGLSVVVDGRFRGGWTTRHYGRPADGVHAVQMELAQRGYLDEPGQRNEQTWPAPYSSARASGMRAHLERMLLGCIDFAARTGASAS